MKKNILILCFVFFLFGCSSSNNDPSPSADTDPVEVTSTYHELVTSRGIVLKYVYSQVENAEAILILFPGGAGTIGLIQTSDGFQIGGTDGFMARNYEDLSALGLNVFLLDAPSDYQGEAGMDTAFRISENHANDIADLIEEIKNDSTLPIWAAGISMGSISTSNMGIMLNEELQGLVLLSAVTSPEVTGNVYGTLPEGILSMSLEEITGNVYIGFHQNDQCPETPPSGVALMENALIGASEVERDVFSGGNTPESHGCGPLSYHSFYGIDATVIEAMSQFIKGE